MVARQKQVWDYLLGPNDSTKNLFCEYAKSRFKGSSELRSGRGFGLISSSVRICHYRIDLPAGFCT